jgi:hypothetical protein
MYIDNNALIFYASFMLIMASNGVTEALKSESMGFSPNSSPKFLKEDLP